MAAATRGTAATMFMAGWGSCWDVRTGSPTVVAAAALQLLRCRTDPHALQLLRTSLDPAPEQMQAAEDHAAAVGWCAELLQVAVAASNGDACGLLCSHQLSQHLSLQQLTNILILAVQMQCSLRQCHCSLCQQKMHVMQHVCKLFSTVAVASVQADVGSKSCGSGSGSGSSSAVSTRACVGQVLACAMQLNAVEVLQKLLLLIPVQDGLLSYRNLYTLQSLALGYFCSPRVVQMLCGLRLSLRWPSDETSASMRWSGAKQHALLHLALTDHHNTPGLSETVQMLATWEPHACTNHHEGSSAAGLGISHSALDGLCQLAEGITNSGERALVLDALYALGGTDYMTSRGLDQPGSSDDDSKLLQSLLYD
jgi:hypothetical protein